MPRKKNPQWPGIEPGFLRLVGQTSCIVRISFFTFYWQLNFLYRFSEKLRISDFMKIPYRGRRVFFPHADGWTNRHDEVNYRFCNSPNAPKNKRVIALTACFEILHITGLSGLSTNGTNMASLLTNIRGLPMAVCLGRSHAVSTQSDYCLGIWS